ncbi:hypothetical protein Tsubulata_028604 [Turnera subulata]|uniref:DUF4283 domain-containing protein n=1 Tax=Turnera subulata TaxID=218843 RepID=A0A9Q0JGW6_9ROSI|nr:hypothetical protein Tsubulata_028604 [Turnera subulata]
MAPAYLLDVAGQVCEKSSLVMDLGQIKLPNPKIASAKQLKGKTVSSVQSPMVFASSEDDSLAAASADATAVEGTSLSNPSAPLFMDIVPPDKLGNGDPSLPKTAPTPWAKVISNPTPYNPQLTFIQPVFNGDSNMLCIPPELLEIGLWVKLQHVPMELLTKEGLSYLSSVLRKPLHADQDCTKIFKSDSANVCVQVDFSKPLLNELKLDINGETVIIDVHYSWKPSHCDFCKGWDHHELACPVKKSVKIWIPKKTNTSTDICNNSTVETAPSLAAAVTVPPIASPISPHPIAVNSIPP